MKKDKYSFLLLFLPGVIYLFLLFYWTDNTGYSHRTTGDEGHYMITSLSLFVDHDFDVKNNYERDAITYEIYGPIDNHVTERNGKYFSTHGLGLPILIAPFVYYYNFGFGAKLIIALIFSVLPFLLSNITHGTINSFVGNLASSSFCIGFPFLMGASQIYNELIVSLLFVFTIISFYNFSNNPSFRVNFIAATLFFVILLFLPWFRDKYIPLYFLIGALYGYYLFKIKSKLFLILTISLLFINLGLFLWYVYTVNGSFVGTNNNSINISNPIVNIKLAFAYIFDRNIGILFSQPLSVFGLLLSIWFIKYDYRTALLTFTLFIFTYLPASLVDWAYQFKFTGLLMNRICWPIYPLFYIPLGFYLKEQKSVNYSIALVAIILIGLQIANLNSFIDIDPQKIIWDYAPVNIFSFLNPILPNFYESILSYQNVAFLLLIVSGVFYTQYYILPEVKERRRLFNYLFKIVFYVCIVGIGLYANTKLTILPKLLTYRNHFHACKHKSQIGGNIQDFTAIGFCAKRATPSDGNGLLMVSNYCTLEKGRYNAVYRIKYSNRIKDGMIGSLTICKDFGEGIANIEIGYNKDFDGEWNEVKIPFEIEKEIQPNIETLLRSYGNTDIECDYVRIEERN